MINRKKITENILNNCFLQNVNKTTKTDLSVGHTECDQRPAIRASDRNGKLSSCLAWLVVISATQSAF